MRFDEVLSHFTVKNIHGNKAQCICPAHKDKHASLTITVSESGKILVHCHAGCQTGDILAAAGLSMQDLFVNSDVPKKEEPWRTFIERREKRRIEDVYHYHTLDGEYAFTRIRLEGKKFVYGRFENELFFYGLQGRGRKNIPAVFCPDMASVKNAIESGRFIFYAEGEKDVKTLARIGLPAVTCGGAEDWAPVCAPLFTGAKVAILADNDDPGRRLAEMIETDLHWFAAEIRTLIPSDKPHGDVSDYIDEGHSAQDLFSLLSKATPKIAPWLPSPDSGRSGINTDFLARAMDRGLEFYIVRRPNEDRDSFYLYDRGVYRLANRNMVKIEVRKRIPAGMATDNALTNTLNLMLCNSRRVRDFEELQGNERFVNLRNGLYDVQDARLLPHDPGYLSTIQLHCNYEEEARRAPVFESFIDDFCKEEGIVCVEKKLFLQEMTGLILSNVKGFRCKRALVLWSLLGNTGKSLFLNILGAFLGNESVISIPLQQMNEQSRFSLGTLPGKRLISIGDQTSSEISDSATLKMLTGGDPVKIEAKGRQAYFYTFPGMIAIACNNLPSITDDKGGHLFERFAIFPCEHHVPPEKRDPFLLDKIKGELPAIFNWAMDGLRRLIGNQYRFTVSESMTRANGEYRDEMDTVHRYLSERYELTGSDQDLELKTYFDGAYLSWCEQNEFKAVNKQNIKKRMAANGCRCNLGDFEGRRGVTVYRGLKRKRAADDMQRF